MEAAVLVVEVVNIILMVVCLWLFVSLILYGTKTNRWRKRASSSSLNTGPIYVLLTLTVFIALLGIINSEVGYHLRRFEGGLDFCEFVMDMDTVLLNMAICLSFGFMWLMQRIIYTHPLVKPNIGKCMSWLSRLFIIWHTLVSIAFAVIFALAHSYDGSDLGCTDNQTLVGEMSSVLNFVPSLTLLATQMMLIFLCIYPSLRVQFESNIEGGATQQETVNKKSKFQRFREIFFGKTAHIVSPIELAVKRTMRNIVIMVLTDVIMFILASFALSSSPSSFTITSQDISIMINVFCMVATLGCVKEILTLCCPNCSDVTFRVISLRRNVATADGVQLEEIPNSNTSWRHDN